MPQFFKDLLRERENERRVAGYIFGLVLGACALFFSCFDGRELFDFGFWSDGRWWLFELKTDYKAGATSQKVFLEVGNARSNKPSGIASTLADRVLINVPALGQIFSFQPKPMLDFLNECEECDYLHRTGDNNARGYLVPLHTLARLPFIKTLKYDA